MGDAFALAPPCPIAEVHEAGPPAEAEGGGGEASSEEVLDVGRDGVRRSAWAGGGGTAGGFGRFAAFFPLAGAGFLKQQSALVGRGGRGGGGKKRCNILKHLGKIMICSRSVTSPPSVVRACAGSAPALHIQARGTLCYTMQICTGPTRQDELL